MRYQPLDASHGTVVSYQHEVLVIDFVETCVDIPKFLLCCEKCPNYRKCWSCPPFDFSPENIWEQFKTLVLFGKKIVLTTDFRKAHDGKGRINDISSGLLAPFKEALFKELLDCEQSYQGSMALSAGKCDICEVCARQHDLPCVNPKYLRYSIEALGGDVGKAIELYFGEKLIWGEKGSLPEYFFLLGGLLKP